METIARLLTLPVEMLAAIAEQADAHDLLALRLVCKEISASSFDVFAKTFFAKRSHLYSCYGLQTLVKITAHPQLVKKVQEIELVCMGVDEDAVRSYGPQKLVGKTEELLRKWVAENDELCKTGKTLIKKVLVNLIKAGVTPGITASLDQRDLVQSHGFTSMLQLLGPPISHRDFEEFNDRAPTSALLTALIATNYPIQRLDLCKGAYDRGLAQRSFEISGRVLTGVQAPFAHLKRLALTFDTLMYRRWEGDNTHETMAKLFRSATALASLSIAASGPDRDACFLLGAISQGLAAAVSLKTVELSKLEASAGSYIAFLECFQNSTTRLSFVDITVPHDECWSTVLSWLANNAKLGHLRLHKLRRNNGSVMLRDGSEVDCEFDGVVAVRESLETLAQEAKYGWMAYQDGSDGSDES